MARELLSIESRERLRYAPLVAAGILVFFCLVMLGGLTGLLWHIYTFDRWTKLNAVLFGPGADWFIWFVSYLVCVSPGVLMLVRRRGTPDLILALTFFILPVFSAAMTIVSYFVGGTLLMGAGFLAAYTLVTRSGRLLRVESHYARKIVCAVVFAFLAIAAAGGVVSIIIWGEHFLLALVSGSSLVPMDIWLSMLAVDMEVFYLARPLLSAIFIALAIVAIVALFRTPFQSITGLILGSLSKEPRTAEDSVRPNSQPQSQRKTTVAAWSPYVILIASVALGISITLYPYFLRQFDGVLGSDSWWYLGELRSLASFADVIPRLRTDRGFFLLFLFIVRTTTGLSPEWVVRLMPGLLSALLALSSFLLVREGTGRLWPAAFAALLSVVSAQTSLGMGAGIITNWFGLSLANFMFALIVRSTGLRSKLAALASLLVSLTLLGSFAFLWVVVIAELAIVLVASILAFRRVDRRGWKYEMGIVSGVLLGSVLVPVAFILAMPILGFQARGPDPSYWLTLGWKYVVHGTTLQVLSSAPSALEEAFDFAGNRIDLPFLTLLSIVGLLDGLSQSRSFRSILAATVLVPVAITVITPGIYHTWRGLYIIPMYLTGALGAESIIRRMNGQGSQRGNRAQLIFAGAFAAYVFLSHLSYSLRALELLIMVASM